MGKKIIVSKPANLSLSDADLFDPVSFYDEPTLKAKYVHSAFVCQTGLAANGKGIIKECYHQNTGQHNKRVKEIARCYLVAKNIPDKLIILDNKETYLLIHHPWHGNYFHWMSETLLRLWSVKDKISKMILLLPAEHQISSYVIPSLAPFKFKDVYHIPSGKSLLVKRLCVAQLKPKVAMYVPKALVDLNKIYLEYISANKIKVEHIGSRVYLSRKKANKRNVVNEEEVISILQQHGFVVLENENYSFFEQVALYSKVNYLISSHGAGLTNMLFMPANSAILEFHKRITNAEDHHSLVFWYMADGLKHKYYHQICDPLDKEADYFDADIRVDISLLKRNLEAIFDDKGERST